MPEPLIVGALIAVVVIAALLDRFETQIDALLDRFGFEMQRGDETEPAPSPTPEPDRVLVDAPATVFELPAGRWGWTSADPIERGSDGGISGYQLVHPTPHNGWNVPVGRDLDGKIWVDHDNRVPTLYV